MKILSIFCYILGGVVLLSAANLMGRAVSTGNEDPAYLLGTLIPVIICIGLGIFFGKIHKHKSIK